MDWGRNSPVCSPRAKRKLTVGTCFSKEPCERSAPIRESETEFHRALRDEYPLRTGNPTARWHANSFAVSVASFLKLFLSNKEKVG